MNSLDFLPNIHEIAEMYKEIIIARAIHGPKIAYQNIEPLAAYAIERHFMDNSTGSLRELAALWLADAEPYPGQHGHDGIRDGRWIECKPRLYKGGKRVDGYGSINDHSKDRHIKYNEHGLIMQQSQFFYGDCAWIVEFPYTYGVFNEHMEKQLAKTEGRICGRFTYKHWWECPDLDFRYINKKIIKKNQNNIVGGPNNNLLFNFLMSQ